VNNSSNLSNQIVNSVSVNNAGNVLAKKSAGSYLPTDITNVQSQGQEPSDKKRSSSATRGQESADYVKKTESVKSRMF
jgi:hypothetical protein